MKALYLLLQASPAHGVYADHEHRRRVREAEAAARRRELQLAARGPRGEGSGLPALLVGGGLASVGYFAAATVGALAGAEIGGSSAHAALPGTAMILGTAGGAAAIGAIQARLGRRAGLLAGYLLGVAGAAFALAGLAAGVLWLLVAGSVALGIANAARLLSRYAALGAAASSAQVVSLVVAAGTIGALLGPNVVGVAADLAHGLRLPPLAGGYLVAVLTTAAALLVTARLPADTASARAARPGAAATDSRAAVLLGPVIALMATAQVAMVLVMSVTALHMHHHGAALGAIGVVFSAHAVGMYAFAPLAGVICSRLGGTRTGTLGLALLVTGSLVAGVTPAGVGLAVGLFATGIGWSLAFVAASAMQREDGAGSPARQGFVDAVGWGLGAAATATASVLLDPMGYPVLALLAAAVAVGGMLTLLWPLGWLPRRRPAPVS